MTNIRKILRWGILGLQLVAMIIFFVLPLFQGSYVSLLWYGSGILQTMMFCFVYFRREKQWRIVSLIISIIFVAIHLGFGFALFMGNMIMAGYGDWGLTPFLYILCMVLAIFLSLCVPQKEVELIN